MTLARVLGLTLLIVLLATGAADQDVFDLQVTRVRILRNQPGDLHIDTAGLTFRSSEDHHQLFEVQGKLW